MTNEAMGTKRICASCAARFFDLGRDPIHCPKCDAVFVVPIPPPPRRPRFARPEPSAPYTAATPLVEEPADVLLDDGDDAEPPVPEPDDEDDDDPDAAEPPIDDDDLPEH